jgi:uridine phosphorylase
MTLAEATYPILEYDPAAEAMIEPSRIHQPVEQLPQRCVICFFNDVLRGLHTGDQIASEVIYTLRSEIGSNPVYVITQPDGQRFAALHPGVGAPLAAGFLEEVIALGCRKFIACGGAGVLDGELAVGHVVVPTSAVRDEGTSYHYLPPGREVGPTAEAVAAVEATLAAHGVPYVTGKTWTTDGLFRETPAKVQRRRAEGCLTVEMEAAAFFAVAQFRQVSFAQMLYSGDNLGGETWDDRDWVRQVSVREALFWWAVEAVQRL